MDFLATSGAPVALAHVLPTLTCLLSALKFPRNDEDGFKSYSGYQVMRIGNVSEQLDDEGYEILKHLYSNDILFDFLTPPSMTTPTDVLLCPEQIENVKRIFEEFNIPFVVKVDDLQKEIDVERVENERLHREDAGMNWKSYQSLETIQGWMDSMAEKYPSIVSVETYGKSTEGRDMKVMKISTGGNSSKPAVWLDGGIHAREWIAPATVTYIANELISEAVNQGPNYRMVDEINYYIMPNINPDGYVYSQTRDRMWRKTRSNDGSFMANVFGCLGTDPNRNWDYKWGGKGTSNNPCSQIYHGPKAASEPEVAQTQSFIFAHKDEFKMVLTLHSYSQMIFIPWAYDNVEAEDKQDLMKVADAGASALKQRYGTVYQTGSPPELLYPASGGTFDWARGVAGVKFSFCYELRDTGRNGFTLPAEQIIPSGEETYDAFNAMVQEVMAYYK